MKKNGFDSEKHSAEQKKSTLKELGSFDIDKFEKVLEDYPRFRKKQAKKNLYVDLIGDWNDSTVLPLELKEKLNKNFPISIYSDVFISDKRQSMKAVIKMEDGFEIESVLMKHKDERNTVCVSSQVGCSLGCKFCSTGEMGFKRNLNYGEIVEQVIFFARLLKKENKKVTNVVFMGMGEPFLNYENVIKAVKVLNDGDGFNLGARNFSISTSGVVDGIENLSREDLQVNLAVSLHAPNNDVRSRIMPVNKKYPLEVVLSAVKKYTEKTRRRVMFEYIMIDGVNDSDDSAKELADKIRDQLCFVNLIRYNQTGNFNPSSSSRIKSFKDILEEKGVRVTQRFEFGGDIKSACGQLIK